MLAHLRARALPAASARASARCAPSRRPAAAWLSDAADAKAEEARVLQEMADAREARARTVTPFFKAAVPQERTDLPANVAETATLNLQPDEQRGRGVVIKQRAQAQMQSATAKTHAWTLTWPHEDRWSNPLMGWSSSADPHAATELFFDTADEAVAFASKQGWPYEVKKSIASKRRRSMGTNYYAHNFLPPTAEAHMKLATANKTNATIWNKEAPHQSHYFRPLKFHGNGTVRQHGPTDCHEHDQQK